MSTRPYTCMKYMFSGSYRNVKLRYQVIICGSISRGVRYRHAVAPVIGYLKVNQVRYRHRPAPAFAFYIMSVGGHEFYHPRTT